MVSGITAGQAGLLTTAQAEAAGVSRSSLVRLCEHGDLERVGQGVYVLAGADDALTPLRAAWLSLAPAVPVEERLATLPGLAVVSHASAAALHRLGDLPHDIAEFTVPGSRRTARTGIRLHQTSLTARDVTIVEGLPTTRIERTIADLLSSRRYGDPEHIARIVGDALLDARLDVGRLAELLDPLTARYKQTDGEAFTAWLVELSGNGPSALAEKLNRTAFGREVVALAVAGAPPEPANGAIRDLIVALSDWFAQHPEPGPDVKTPARFELSHPQVAATLDALRRLSPEDQRTITERGTREARQAGSNVDPATVRAIAAIARQR